MTVSENALLPGPYSRDGVFTNLELAKQVAGFPVMPPASSTVKLQSLPLCEVYSTRPAKLQLGLN